MSSNAIAVTVTFLFCFIFPIGLLIWWKKRTGEGILSFIAGAVCFTLFALVLERRVLTVLLTGTIPWHRRSALHRD